MNMKNKKQLIIIAIVTGLIGVCIYIGFTILEIKKYEGYTQNDYNEIAKEEYARNYEILENGDKIEQIMPQVSDYIKEIEVLNNKDRKNMKINEKIEVSNKIESNVTKIIGSYESDTIAKENEDLKNIMKEIIELDSELSNWQISFNDRLYHERTGYNDIFYKRATNRLIATLYGLPKVENLKTK